MKNSSKRIFCLLGSLLLLSGTGSAALAASCTVSTTSINFGNYDVFSNTAASTTGTVTVLCSPAGSPYTIELNSGLHGTINQRYLALAGGTDSMPYGVFTDPVFSTNWGDGTGNSVTVSGTSPDPNQIYAQISAGQDVSAGSYTDMITVSVSF